MKFLAALCLATLASANTELAKRQATQATDAIPIVSLQLAEAGRASYFLSRNGAATVVRKMEGTFDPAPALYNARQIITTSTFSYTGCFQNTPTGQTINPYEREYTTGVVITSPADCAAKAVVDGYKFFAVRENRCFAGGSNYSSYGMQPAFMCMKTCAVSTAQADRDTNMCGSVANANGAAANAVYEITYSKTHTIDDVAQTETQIQFMNPLNPNEFLTIPFTEPGTTVATQESLFFMTRGRTDNQNSVRFYVKKNSGSYFIKIGAAATTLTPVETWPVSLATEGTAFILRKGFGANPLTIRDKYN